MRRAITQHLEDPRGYGASSLRTITALGLAASLLFLALTLVVLGAGGGDGEDGSAAGRDGAEVLGATLGPQGDLEVASTDGGAFFLYAEDPRQNVAGSATVVMRGEGDVSLTVTGSPSGDRGVISATVQNHTGDVILFEDGLSVRVEITSEGLPWKTVEPADRSVTELPPGESATVSTEVALDAFGEYELSGEVFYGRS